MTISHQELKHILKLSKLKAHQDELVQFEHDLNNIFSMFDSLKLVDTQDIKPLVSPLTNHYSSHLDVSKIQQHAKSFQSISPEFTKHHFIVPKVIE